MKTTGMFVCACLTFILGSTELQTADVESNTTVAGNSTDANFTTQSPMTTPLSDRPTHVTSSYTSSAGNTGRPSDSSHTTAANNNSSQQTTASTGPTDDSGATSVTGQHSTSGNPAPTTTPTSTGESVTLLRVYSQLLIPVVSVLLYGAQG